MIQTNREKCCKHVNNTMEFLGVRSFSQLHVGHVKACDCKWCGKLADVPPVTVVVKDGNSLTTAPKKQQLIQPKDFCKLPMV